MKHSNLNTILSNKLTLLLTLILTLTTTGCYETEIVIRGQGTVTHAFESSDPDSPPSAPGECTTLNVTDASYGECLAEGTTARMIAVDNQYPFVFDYWDIDFIESQDGDLLNTSHCTDLNVWCEYIQGNEPNGGVSSYIANAYFKTYTPYDSRTSFKSSKSSPGTALMNVIQKVGGLSNAPSGFNGEGILGNYAFMLQLLDGDLSYSEYRDLRDAIELASELDHTEFTFSNYRDEWRAFGYGLPDIKLFDSGEIVSYAGMTDVDHLPELQGAYSNEGVGTIYLNRKLFEPDSDPAQTFCVLVQEYAHHLNRRLRGDSNGGEGIALATRLCEEELYNSLSPGQIRALNNHNDNATVNIDGRIINVKLGFWRNFEIGAGVVVGIGIAAVLVLQPELIPFVAAAAEAGEAGAEAVELVEIASETAEIVSETGEVALDVIEASEDLSLSGSAVMTDVGLTNYSGALGQFADDALEAAHENLINRGYQFVGFHGTSTAGAINLVGGDTIGTTTLANPIWNGLYVSDTPAVSAGYAIDESGTFPTLGRIIRVYLKAPNASKLVNIPANLETQQASNIVTNIVNQSDYYLFRGAQSASELSTETVISPTLAQTAKFLPSNVEAAAELSGEITRLPAWEAALDLIPGVSP